MTFCRAAMTATQVAFALETQPASKKMGGSGAVIPAWVTMMLLRVHVWYEACLTLGCENVLKLRTQSYLLSAAH